MAKYLVINMRFLSTFFDVKLTVYFITNNLIKLIIQLIFARECKLATIYCVFLNQPINRVVTEELRNL